MTLNTDRQTILQEITRRAPGFPTAQRLTFRSSPPVTRILDVRLPNLAQLTWEACATNSSEHCQGKRIYRRLHTTTKTLKSFFQNLLSSDHIQRYNTMFWIITIKSQNVYSLFHNSLFKDLDKHFTQGKCGQKIQSRILNSASSACLFTIAVLDIK